MDPFYEIQQADLFNALPAFPEDTFDVLVTDPPYGIGFMGREWDTFKPDNVRTAAAMKQRKNPEQLAELKNVYGRKRSPAQSPSQIAYDYSAAGLRGFQDWTERWAREVFRVLKPGAHALVFGAPRSHHRMMSGLEDAGFEIRDCFMWLFGQGFPKSLNLKGDWKGWGTALKPAWEPIAVARKPFKGSLTTNVEKWGTGVLNIDGCRVPYTDAADMDQARVPNPSLESESGLVYGFQTGKGRNGEMFDPSKGRWPAHLILDEEAGAALDAQVPGVSRFFYCPKVSRAEREFGCEHLPARTAGEMTGGRKEGSAGLNNPRAGAGRTSGSHNAHPTVKPIALMRYLCRLVTPPGGLILDPFTGSGTTGIAATLEGFNFIGIEREAEWVTVADARIAAWMERERAA